MRPRRVDNHHAEIRKALSKAGYFVIDLSQAGNGIPDLLVLHQETVTLLEIKTAGAGLTPLEEKFFRTYPGRAYIVRSVEEALFYCRPSIKPTGDNNNGSLHRENHQTE